MKNDDRLNLMRFWLIGTFAIICVATTVYGGFVFGYNWFQAFQISLPVWGITGALCVAWYYVYKLYLKRRD